MKRGLVIACVFGLLSALATRAEAQFGRRQGYNGANWWLSASGGYTWGDRVTDPKSNADWRFDKNWSAQFVIEREIAPGVSAGLSYSYARLPLRYQSLDPSGTCDPCRGDATIASYGLNLRSGGGGRGLHFASEFFVGAVQYSHFTLEGTSATALAARDISNTDFAYGIGVGFGYAIARDFEWLTMFNALNGTHERTDDRFGQRSSRHNSLRTGLRVGVF